MTNRFSQCVLDCPSVLDSGNNRVWLDSCLIRPLAEIHRFALELYQSRIAAIFHLFRSCCPPTIVRRIWAIIIDAFNRMLWTWRLSHIQKKAIEIKPSITDEYASSAISCKSFVFWVKASFFHILPSVISFCWRIIDAMLMSAVSFFGGFYIKASARFDISLYQTWARNNLFRTAIANTQPFCVFARCRQRFNSQSTKSTADKIFNVCHVVNYSIRTQIDKWMKERGHEDNRPGRDC